MPLIATVPNNSVPIRLGMKLLTIWIWKIDAAATFLYIFNNHNSTTADYIMTKSALLPKWRVSWPLWLNRPCQIDWWHSFSNPNSLTQRNAKKSTKNVIFGPWKSSANQKCTFQINKTINITFSTANWAMCGLNEIIPDRFLWKFHQQKSQGAWTDAVHWCTFIRA